MGFAAEGANLTIAEIDTDLGEHVAEEAIRQGAAGVHVLKTDVTGLEQVKTSVPKTFFPVSREGFGLRLGGSTPGGPWYRRLRQ